MQLGKATLVEVNDELNAHKSVWQIVLFYFGISRETPEMARLRTSAAVSEKRCLEAETKLQASIAETCILREHLAVARARQTYLTLGLVFYIVTHPTGSAFLIGLVLLGVVYGNHLLRLAESLSSYASQQIPKSIAFLIQLIERLDNQIRNRMRGWSWKSFPVAGSLNTTP